jgi:ATP-dependent RNA helicase HelY
LLGDAECEFGDVLTYKAALDAERGVRAVRGGGSHIERALSSLKPGDILWIDGSGGHDRVVVLSVSNRKSGTIRVKVLNARRNVVQLGSKDFDEEPTVVAHIDLPVPFTPMKPKFQKAVSLELDRIVKRLPSRDGENQDQSQIRSQSNRDTVERHAVHGCPERDSHLRALRDAERVRREIEGLEKQIRSRTGSLVEHFDRILQMLEQWGYLDGWKLTDRGERLVRTWPLLKLSMSNSSTTYPPQKSPALQVPSFTSPEPLVQISLPGSPDVTSSNALANWRISPVPSHAMKSPSVFQ